MLNHPRGHVWNVFVAVMNVSNPADFDYMLIAAPGRVWTARAFALAFNRLTRLRGDTLCPNLILSETALEWPVHDLYSINADQPVGRVILAECLYGERQFP